jgi:hypothetical protein
VLRVFKAWLFDGDKSFADRYIYEQLNGCELSHCGFVRANLSFSHAQQDKTWVFPPIPMKRVIDEKELSPFAVHKKEALMALDKTVMSFEKLVYDFTPKVQYDIYAPALKWLVVNDMVTVDEVTAYLPTKAEYAMAPFIEAMTSRRIEAQKMINEGKATGNAALKRKGETLKDFYKLINNSAYGKTIQDDSKFHKVVLSTHAADNAKYLVNYIINDCKVVSRPDASYGPDDEGMCQFSAINPSVRIKAPRHMGAGILWNSKIVILDFLYNCLLPACPETEIYYTDTDSVHVKMAFKPAPAEYVAEIARKFGVDDSRSASISGSGTHPPGVAQAIASLYARFTPETRAKFFPEDKDDIVAGKMKVDQIFFPGAEGVYLKAKTYIETNLEPSHPQGVSPKVGDSVGRSLRDLAEGRASEGVKPCGFGEGKAKIAKVKDKGVSLRQNSDQLTLDNYKASLYGNKAFKGKNEMIRKVNGPSGQYMATLEQGKWILDPFNDKRYEVVNDDGSVVTYPYGYYRIADEKAARLIANLHQRVYTFMRNNEALRAHVNVIGEEERLGIDSEGLKIHIERQFTEGMCWGNYGLLHAGWNVDHVVPVSKLKRAIGEDGTVNANTLRSHLTEVCAYTNLRPMWKRENSAKGGE